MNGDMNHPSGTRVLLELLHGRGAHTDPVACIADLTAESAGRVVMGSPHSIWQLVWHLNFWMDYDLRRIGGESPRYPVHNDESFPPAAAPRDSGEWPQAQARFQELLAACAVLAESGPDVLEREVPPTHPSQAQRASTVLAMLWQNAAHNSYHMGQIALLRRAMGIWPPPGGGDTW
jgi:uncharacterized damage-inducible protein DinB